MKNDDNLGSFQEVLENPEHFLTKEIGACDVPVHEAKAADSQNESSGYDGAKATPLIEQATNTGPPPKHLDHELPEGPKDVATDANEVAAWQEQLVEIFSRSPSSWTVAWWQTLCVLFVEVFLNWQ